MTTTGWRRTRWGEAIGSVMKGGEVILTRLGELRPNGDALLSQNLHKPTMDEFLKVGARFLEHPGLYGGEGGPSLKWREAGGWHVVLLLDRLVRVQRVGNEAHDNGYFRALGSLSTSPTTDQEDRSRLIGIVPKLTIVPHVRLPNPPSGPPHPQDPGGCHHRGPRSPAFCGGRTVEPYGCFHSSCPRRL